MPDGCLLPRGSAPIKHRARRVARPARRGAPSGVLGQVADHLDEFLSAVAVPAGEPDQAPGLGEDRAAALLAEAAARSAASLVRINIAAGASDAGLSPRAALAASRARAAVRELELLTDGTSMSPR
jgi:hypothetical protein